MNLSPLTALSPLDGRYSNKLTPLRSRFSEHALIFHRVKIEVEWLKALSNHPDIPEVPIFSKSANTELDTILRSFGETDAQEIKAIEKRTNHDVKAVEHWLTERTASHTEISNAAAFFHLPAPQIRLQRSGVLQSMLAAGVRAHSQGQQQQCRLS